MVYRPDDSKMFGRLQSGCRQTGKPLGPGVGGSLNFSTSSDESKLLASLSKKPGGLEAVAALVLAESTPAPSGSSLEEDEEDGKSLRTRFLFGSSSPSEPVDSSLSPDSLELGSSTSGLPKACETPLQPRSYVDPFSRLSSADGTRRGSAGLSNRSRV